MEDQIRKIVREEIARALSAVENAAGSASNATGDARDVALGAISGVMERVARDVLANVHPVLSTEHAPDDACTCGHDRYRHRSGACFACPCPGFTDPLGHAASTEPVHTITAVPERARAACTCHRHTHVMGHDDRCGAPFCYCLSPVRAQSEHTSRHNPGECTTCGHRPHAAGECEWWGENPCFCTKHTSKHNPGCGHTVCDGWSDCRSWTGVEPEHTSTEAPRTCTVCEHGEHDQGKCTMHVYLRGVASPCPCLASRTVPGTEACSCPGGHRKAVNGQCQVCGHKAHNPAGCTGRRSFE